MENNKNKDLNNQPNEEKKKKKGIALWWSNLGKTGQIVISCLGGAAVVTAVTVPTVIAINKNKTVSKTADVTGDGKDLVKQPSFTKQSDGSYKGKLEISEGKSKDDIKKIEIKAGNKVLLKDTDYTISDSFEIVIKAGVISNDNDNITIVVTKAVFYTINLNAESGGSVKGAGSFKEGTSITVTAIPNTYYLFDGWYENDQKITDAEASYTFVATKDRTLKAKFKYDSKAFETCDWSFIKDACDALEAANFTEDAKTAFCNKFTINGETPKSMDDFVGVERVVKVNNQDHKVRVIGIEHDKDENNKALALTFEFANLISDSDGYSLAYQWNDYKDRSGSGNWDYPNSSVRKVLCGSGEFATNVYCATKSSISEVKTPNWDSNYTYTSDNNKTILSMLPTDLSNVLKTTKKSVITYKNAQGETEEKEFNDKLFMLSAREYGLPVSGTGQERYQATDSGTTYKYYENVAGEDSKRVKTQVNLEGALQNTVDIIFDPNEYPTVYKGSIKVFAGYNSPTENQGGYYWTRTIDNHSDNPYSNTGVWYGAKDGGLYRANTMIYARAVAPGFCI